MSDLDISSDSSENSENVDVIDKYGGEGYGSLTMPCPYSEEPIASKSWKEKKLL